MPAPWDEAKATTHGMRSTFRDWCGDHPREIAEAALAPCRRERDGSRVPPQSVGEAARPDGRSGAALHVWSKRLSDQPPDTAADVSADWGAPVPLLSGLPLTALRWQ
jgi:hypothetical protein